MASRRTFYLGLLLLVSCTREKEESDRLVVDERQLPLLEPAVEEKASSRRCSPLPGGKHVTLRSSTQSGGTKSNSSAAELGTAAAVAGGYALGALIHGTETHAHVQILDGRGRSQVADLGRVHGSVDPPQVVSMGDEVVVAFMDNDAGHQRLRLARVKSIVSRPEVALGPEVQVPRGEETVFSLAVTAAARSEEGPAGGLLTWDALDKSSQKSRIFALGFDPVSMKVSRKERVISPPQDDAVSPLVLSKNGGFWSMWLSYQDKSQESSASDSNAAFDSLVEERPRSLRVQQLSMTGEPLGEPLSVTDPQDTVFSYVALTLKSGGLLIAYRGASLGRTEGASPIHLRKVGDDGSVVSGLAEHIELGLGSPALLGGGASDLVWLSARGRENEILLGGVSDAAEVSQFDLENNLSGHMPLVRRGDQLLVAQPDGFDLKLSVVHCNF